MSKTKMACFVWVSVMGAATVVAQTPAIEQLKAKLQQLEQSTQQTVQELKSQIAALEQMEKPPGAVRQTTTVEAVTPPVPIPQTPVHIGQATRLRDTAQQNELTAARINNEAIDPELRGFFRLPGTSTLMRLNGYVKTDVIYDVNYAGSYYGAYVPSSFPSSSTPKSPNATVSMRPSRFAWETRTGVLGNSGDTVKTLFEFDFYSNYDRNSIRLRQFYGQYKNFLAGQTWSAFGDPDVFPDTLEFQGPPGIMASRFPQVRYTQPAGDRSSFGISVEKPGVDTPFSTQFGAPIGTSKFPDLIGFYRYENDYGHIHAAALFRSVGGVIPNTTVPDLKAHTGGFGGSLSGQWNLGSRNNIVFQAIIGKGISNYYNDNYGLGTDVGFAADGHLVATPTGSGHVGYTHHWSKTVRSSLSYAYLQINNTARAPGTEYHISHYTTANVIVQPTVRYLFGLEYIYGSLERKDGFKWISPRIQASITYYINKYPRE